MRQPYKTIRNALGGTLLLALLLSAPALAAPYSQLQVLLPGESPAPGTVSGKVGTPAQQTVGVPFAVTVRAVDEAWNLDATVSNFVKILATDATADLPAPAALAGGQAQFALTLNAAGSFSLFAHDLSDGTIPDGVSSPVSALSLQGFVFGAITQKHQNAGVPISVSLTAVDPNGNTVTGFTGSVELRQLTSFGEGRVEPAVVTFSGGHWSGGVACFRADETNISHGNVNLQAELPANSAINGTSDPFVVHPGPFQKLQIVVPGQNPAPGSIAGLTGSAAAQSAGDAFPVYVYGTDNYWNLVPTGDTVRLSSSDPAGNTPLTGALSGGQRTFSAILGTVGAQTLTVTDQSNGAITGMTCAPIQVLPNGASQFGFEPIPSPQTAGVGVTITVRAEDDSGNLIPDYAGSANLTANTGPGTITPELITFTGGLWTGEVVLRGAGGSVRLTCSDFGGPPNTGTSAPVQVLPGPFVGLQVLLPGQTALGGTVSGYQGEPSAQAAGTAFNCAIRAVDAYWNRVTGVNDALALSASDAQAALPGSAQLSNGEALVAVTFYATGEQTLTAADAANAAIAAHTSRPVTINGGPFARLLILAPGETLTPGAEDGRGGAATDQSINYAFLTTVYATDAWWNPVSGIAHRVHLSSNDPLAEFGEDAPLVDGVGQFSVRLATGGYQQITATDLDDPAVAPSTTQVRAISSGFHLEAELDTGQAMAGEGFTLTVRVTNDAGSVIQEINSAVTVAVRNASSQQAGCGILSTTQFQLLQGQRSITETYTCVESIVLLVSDDAGNTPATTEPITIVPGPPASLTLTASPSWLHGNSNATLTATLMDAFANPVPAAPVTFIHWRGGGTLTPADSLTNAAGVALSDFLSSRSIGTDSLSVAAGGLAAGLLIETAHVDPNAAGGLVTNYPNPFHPGESPTTIAYVLDDNARVTLKIFTLSGGLVLKEEFPSGGPGGTAGLNEFVWDGRNGESRFVASGGYLLLVEAEGVGETLHVMRRKIAVVR